MKQRRQVGLALVVLAGTALCPRPLWAQGNAEAASEAFSRGKKLYDSGSYVEAIASFEQAYRLRPHFMVQCSIARCYEHVNKPIEAVRHFKRCLDEGGSKTKLATSVGESVARLEAQICRVEVESPGKGGTVYANGADRGRAPVTIRLNPGSHVVEVRRDGAKPATATVRLLGGEQRTLTLVPVDVAVPAPATQPVVVKPRKRPRRGLAPAWFWTAAAVTAALAVTTTVLGVQTLSLKSDYEGKPTQEAADDFWARRRLTNICLAATLVAAGTGTALFFFTDFGGGREARPDDNAAVSFGVGLSGSF
jgi:hypothetical protein